MRDPSPVPNRSAPKPAGRRACGKACGLSDLSTHTEERRPRIMRNAFPGCPRINRNGPRIYGNETRISRNGENYEVLAARGSPGFGSLHIRSKGFVVKALYQKPCNRSRNLGTKKQEQKMKEERKNNTPPPKLRTESPANRSKVKSVFREGCGPTKRRLQTALSNVLRSKGDKPTARICAGPSTEQGRAASNRLRRPWRGSLEHGVSKACREFQNHRGRRLAGAFLFMRDGFPRAW